MVVEVDEDEFDSGEELLDGWSGQGLMLEADAGSAPGCPEVDQDQPMLLASSGESLLEFRGQGAAQGDPGETLSGGGLFLRCGGDLVAQILDALQEGVGTDGGGIVGDGDPVPGVVPGRLDG